MTEGSSVVTSANHMAVSSSYDLESGPNVRQVLEEQDQGLDSLHGIIVRSRRVAENIEGEVVVQNEIIDGLGKLYGGHSCRIRGIQNTSKDCPRTHSHRFVFSYYR